MMEVDLGWAGLGFVLLLGSAAGVISLLAFRRFADPDAVRRDVNRIMAHLLEFRLFADHPRAIWGAQIRLLRSAIAILRHAWLPSLVVLVPLAVLLLTGEAVCGHASLAAGQATVVTATFSPTHFPRSVRLGVPAGVQIETPAVRANASHEIAWRVRALHSIDGDLEVIIGAEVFAKSLSAKDGLHWISEKRSSIGRFFSQPFEKPFRTSAIEAITVRYPDATIFGYSWSGWFWLGSILGAVTLTKSIYREPLP